MQNHAAVIKITGQL